MFKTGIIILITTFFVETCSSFFVSSHQMSLSGEGLIYNLWLLSRIILILPHLIIEQVLFILSLNIYLHLSFLLHDLLKDLNLILAIITFNQTSCLQSCLLSQWLFISHTIILPFMPSSSHSEGLLISQAMLHLPLGFWPCCSLYLECYFLVTGYCLFPFSSWLLSGRISNPTPLQCQTSLSFLCAPTTRWMFFMVAHFTLDCYICKVGHSQLPFLG